jgi:hypothetical protein
VIQNDYGYLSMVTMFENLRGNYMGGVELTFA